MLPARFDPLAPLDPDDSPGFITRYKLSALNDQPEACLALLSEAQRRGYIQFRPQPSSSGRCPLEHAVRVTGFGPVRLSSSFLASCPLALRSAMFISQQARPLSQSVAGSPLVQIDHLGSYACRNIYHRENARLSEHAQAAALDVSGLRLADGTRITVLKGWGKSSKDGELLASLWTQSCRYYGNAIGPNYNAAHANHFHLGARGFGYCR
ncbi:extensin [Salmonella enterica subsp. enterica serovar Choleraesuis]|nr:extensin [Salmonella enterica subsp. enterica serovar Choleraesuis]